MLVSTTIATGVLIGAGYMLDASNAVAQSTIDVYYYGYGFDTGYEEYYYWYRDRNVD